MDRIELNKPLRLFDRADHILDVNEGKMRITAVLTTQLLASDGLVLPPEAHKTTTKTIPQLWVHGMGLRDYLPTGSVSNFRVERVKFPEWPQLGDVPSLVGDCDYYSPGEAVKHLQTDAVTLPAVIFDMKRQGHFRGRSIGFHVCELESRKADYVIPGWISDGDMAMVREWFGCKEDEAPTARSWFLNEVSDVPVGADPLALDSAISRAKGEGRISQRQIELLLGRECHNCGHCTTTIKELPKFTLADSDEARAIWAEFVDNNSHDAYGKRIAEYAATWANLMEAALIDGAKVADIAEQTSHTADTDGITGFMFGSAARILIAVWIHGDGLREWLDKLRGRKSHVCGSRIKTEESNPHELVTRQAEAEHQRSVLDCVAKLNLKGL